jgi:SAM-dependent methyltransferase
MSNPTRGHRTVKLLTEIAKNTLVATPLGKRYLRKRRAERGYNASTNEPAYCRRVFDYQSKLISKYRPFSGTLLEIGPGRNLGVAALFVHAGCKSAVCIDIENWLDPTPTLYRDLGVEADLACIEYRSSIGIEDIDYPPDSFDIIVSHTTAEYFQDPEAAVRNITRLLAPGGVTVHHIRVQGHWNEEKPFDFLRHSEMAWRLATSHRPGQPNRWRISDWTSAFEHSGARVVEIDVPKRVQLTEHDRQGLASRFRTKPLDDLSIYNARIVALSGKPTG